jgi:hypothetical protein
MTKLDINDYIFEYDDYNILGNFRPKDIINYITLNKFFEKVSIVTQLSDFENIFKNICEDLIPGSKQLLDTNFESLKNEFITDLFTKSKLHLYNKFPKYDVDIIFDYLKIWLKIGSTTLHISPQLPQTEPHTPLNSASIMAAAGGARKKKSKNNNKSKYKNNIRKKTKNNIKKKFRSNTKKRKSLKKIKKGGANQLNLPLLLSLAIGACSIMFYYMYNPASPYKYKILRPNIPERPQKPEEEKLSEFNSKIQLVDITTNLLFRLDIVINTKTIPLFFKIANIKDNVKDDKFSSSEKHFNDKEYEDVKNYGQYLYESQLYHKINEKINDKDDLKYNIIKIYGFGITSNNSNSIDFQIKKKGNNIIQTFEEGETCSLNLGSLNKHISILLKKSIVNETFKMIENNMINIFKSSKNISVDYTFFKGILTSIDVTNPKSNYNNYYHINGNTINNDINWFDTFEKEVKEGIDITTISTSSPSKNVYKPIQFYLNLNSIKIKLYHINYDKPIVQDSLGTIYFVTTYYIKTNAGFHPIYIYCGDYKDTKSSDEGKSLYSKYISYQITEFDKNYISFTHLNSIKSLTSLSHLDLHSQNKRILDNINVISTNLYRQGLVHLDLHGNNYLVNKETHKNYKIFGFDISILKTNDTVITQPWILGVTFYKPIFEVLCNKNVDLFLKVGRLKDFYYIYAVNYVFEYIPIIDNYILLIINDMNYDTEGTFELFNKFNTFHDPIPEDLLHILKDLFTPEEKISLALILETEFTTINKLKEKWHYYFNLNNISSIVIIYLIWCSIVNDEMELP